MEITREKFIAVVGRDPIMDELDRCNCPLEGEVGHFQCGWCPKCQYPRFMCGHIMCGHVDAEYESRMALPGSLDDYQEGENS